MTSLRDGDVERFVERLRAKLELGARVYGDRSFSRPLTELITEIGDELVDTAGWALLLHTRLERLRGQIERVEQEGGIDG
jgi:hypothetical protein